MVFRFVHAADLHLDTPFEGLQRSDGVLGKRLVEASLDALDALVAMAIREQAEFVLLAGDLYDGAERGLRAQLRLHGATQRLATAGIRTFIVHGNHDPIDEGWSAIGAWPAEVTIFPSERVDTNELTTSDGSRVTVTGTSYARRHETENLSARYPGRTGTEFRIAVLHANVGSDEHAPYSPCCVEDLRAAGYDYWALGHIHRRATLLDRPRIAYPGNLQGRSFKPSEQGPKGALLVTVDKGIVHDRFVELGPIRFEEYDVDVAGCEDVAGVLGRVLAAASAVASRELVVRVVLRGITKLHEELHELETIDPLLESLRDRAPRIHWDSIEVETTPDKSLAELASREDLRGQLAREALQRIAQPLDIRKLLRREEATADLLDELGDTELASLTADAAALAFNALERR